MAALCIRSFLENPFVPSLSDLTPEQRSALQEAAWFASLPAPVQDELLRRSRLRTLTAEQCLYRRGEQSDALYIVVEGCLRVGGTSAEGCEALLNFYAPGSWIGEVSVLEGCLRTHDAHAHMQSRVLQVSASDFEELLANHPGFCRLMLRLTAQRLHLLLEGFEAVSTYTQEQLLAFRLLTLAGSYGVASTEGVRIELRLSQETLAQLVGSTRQRVNQILQQWQAQGLIERQRAGLTLRDPAALQMLVARVAG